MINRRVVAVENKKLYLKTNNCARPEWVFWHWEVLFKN